MNVSYDWLRALVPLDETPAQVRDLITGHVATVDEMTSMRADLAPFVVARVVEAGQHPDSDHLWVTKVDAGTGELLDVVCGAPNVVAGTLYPFAPVGTVMPNGMKIERRKIRGAVSAGMLCSPRELGLGEDHEGILALAVDVAPGTPFLEAMPTGDTRLVVDVSPNRPDLLSQRGMAREVAAAVGARVALPAIPGAGAIALTYARAADSGTADDVSVRVDAETKVRRYLGAVMRGVKVGPSPEWLVRRLESVGSRAINNVVDATNYVLHELGQPIHAFDLASLAGKTVHVRRAYTDEKMITLDGVERRLDRSMTVIADGERAQAIAGVMGGRDSEVGEKTPDLFIEVASFDPAGTRATRRTVGLSTDASYRFERGVDPELGREALERVVAIIAATAGGRVHGSVADIGSEAPSRQTVTLRVPRLAAILGEPISADEATRLLRSVGFEVQPATANSLAVGVPSWRIDVVDEVDLVEEVARLRGYDRIPSDVRPFRPSEVPDAPEWITARGVREALVGAGLLETRPMPFVAGDDTSHVRVRNPIAENEAHLRRSILESLVQRAEYNLSRMQGDVRLFEIGNVFRPSTAGLPVEEMRVGALVMGRRRPRHFSDPKSAEFATAMTIDAWDAKGLAELIATRAFPDGGVALRGAGETTRGAGETPRGAGEITRGSDETRSDARGAESTDRTPPLAAESGALWTILVDGRAVGSVHHVRLDAPVWASAAFGIEVSLGAVDSAGVTEREAAGSGRARGARAAPAERRSPYRPAAQTPVSELDLALVVPPGVSASDIDRVIRQTSGDILERLELMDEYVGSGMKEGARSLAWRLTFRHPERTLSAKEIDGRKGNVLRQLEKSLDVRQRTS